MIQCSMVADPNGAVAAYKEDASGNLAGAFLLSGFGTKPVPCAICEDGIQKAVEFAAHHLQVTIDALLDNGCDDIDLAVKSFSHQMDRLNRSIAWFGSNIGQGIYLAGVICYIAADRYLCLPFGGASAYLNAEEELLPLTNGAVAGSDPFYVYDALGWTARHGDMFSVGSLHPGDEILCLTQKTPQSTVESVIDQAQSNLELAATSLYAGLRQFALPRAVCAIELSAARDVNSSGRKGGVESGGQ